MSDIFRRHAHSAGQRDDTSTQYSADGFSVLPWTGTGDDTAQHTVVLDAGDDDHQVEAAEPPAAEPLAAGTHPGDWPGIVSDGAAIVSDGSGASQAHVPPGTDGFAYPPAGAHAADVSAGDDATTGSATTAPVPDEPYDDDFDDEFNLHEQYGGRRVSRLTVLLGVGIIAAAGFAGGVALQKNHDVSLTTSSASAGAGRASGFGAGGGFGGAGAAGLGSGTGATGTGTTSGAAAAGGAATAAPVVVGTITAVHGNTVLVKDFAGATVTVNVPPTATVTTPGLTPLAAGMTASVTGTKAGTTVTATTVTAHRPA